MLQAYLFSFYVGKFMAGALFGGLAAMIVFFVKKRWAIGILPVLISGALGCWNSWASIIAGVIFLIIAIVTPRKVSYTVDVNKIMNEIKEKEETEKTSEVLRQERENAEPSENEWKCPNCGRINQNYVGTCGCGTLKP